MFTLTASRSRLSSSLRSFNHRSLDFWLWPMFNMGPQTTMVEQYLLNQIKDYGPLPISTYMRHCLSYPVHGFYMNPESVVFGSRRDLTTSPDIRQIFGELIAIWLLAQYHKSGKDIPLRIIELGPGKGTLMLDILRVFSKLIPGKKIGVHLVEISPTMRATQQSNFAHGDHTNVKVLWHNSINTLRPSFTEYTMIVAHEFFDVLPVNVLQKTGTDWREVLVAANPEGNKRAKANPDVTTPPPLSFRRVLEPQTSVAAHEIGHSSLRFQNLPDGSSVEVSRMSFSVAQKVGELLTSEKPYSQIGGCGLIIDYGADHAFSDSLRALKDHEVVDIFHQPGLCDLTTNVDFAYLKEAMGDLVTTLGPMPQGKFLMQLGLPFRLEGLLKAAKTDERRQEIRSAAASLVDPTGMRKEYQVMGITSEASEKMNSASTWPFPDPDPTGKKGRKI